MNPSISLLKADNIWGLGSIRPADHERKQTPYGARFASTEEKEEGWGVGGGVKFPRTAFSHKLEICTFPTFTSSMVLLEKFMYWALPMKMAAAKMRTLMKSNLYLSSSLPLLSTLRTISNSQLLVATVKMFFFLLFFLILFLFLSVGWAYICVGAQRLQKRALDSADLEQQNMGSGNQILVLCNSHPCS